MQEQQQNNNLDKDDGRQAERGRAEMLKLNIATARHYLTSRTQGRDKVVCYGRSVKRVL